MDREEALERLVKAGEIAYKAVNMGARLIKPGTTCLEVCARVEEYIVALGGKPAFPCNISINEVAAHFTPGIKDDTIIPERGVVKLDVGVHIDGFIADTAVTVDLSGENAELLDAAREALEAVAKKIRPGISLYELGKTISSEITRRGFKPIRNLYGHSIGQYLIHAGMNVPNYPERTFIIYKLRPGTLVAIEPFATNGRGFVRDGPIVNIYAYTGRKPKAHLADDEAELLSFIEREYKTLPFAPRWLAGRAGIPEDRLLDVIKRLEAKGVIKGYPVLVEAGRGLVSQFEHTFLVLKNEVLITTLPGTT